MALIEVSYFMFLHWITALNVNLKYAWTSLEKIWQFCGYHDDRDSKIIFSVMYKIQCCGQCLKVVYKYHNFTYFLG